MAARFALLPSTQLGDVILAAVFPAYSLMQQDVTRVSKAFLRTLSLAGMLIMGATALIALGLPRLFILILGEQWVQAAPLVPVIAVAGGAQAMLRIGSPLYLGTGRPRLQFFLDLAQTATMLMLLYPMGHRYGLVGLPFAMLGGVLSALPIWWLGIRRSTACTWREVGSALLPPGVGVGVMSLVFWAGQMPAALPSESALGIMWHIMLTIIAALGFLATIGISQQLIPRYSPLIEMQRVLRGVRLRLAPAFISNRNVLH
jgi:O-antigen/teichoic acid export membrane protein